MDDTDHERMEGKIGVLWCFINTTNKSSFIRENSDTGSIHCECCVSEIELLLELRGKKGECKMEQG